MTHRLHVFGGHEGFSICACNLQEVVAEAEQMLADALGSSSELVLRRSTARAWLAEHLGAEHGLREADPGFGEFVELVLDVVWRHGTERSQGRQKEPRALPVATTGSTSRCTLDRLVAHLSDLHGLLDQAVVHARERVAEADALPHHTTTADADLSNDEREYDYVRESLLDLAEELVEVLGDLPDPRLIQEPAA